MICRSYPKRRAIRGASLLVLSALATAAHGQQAETPAPQDDSNADIVVTAQFRSTNLQDTPLAITALTGEQLADRSFNNIADVGRAAPSVTLRLASSGYGKSTQAYIRGIGQTDFNFALEPAVGFYVDDVYHASLFGTSFDLLDLERIEILRGPQGTLFGKNSIGGAVRLISQKPRDRFEASIEGTYGSYDRIDLRGMVNIPLVAEQLALRLSFASKERDGYVDRVDFACAYPELAGNLTPTVSQHGNSCKLGTLGGESVRAGRAALRWTPSSDIEVNLAAEIIRDNSEGAADSLIYINTAATALVNHNNNRLIPAYGIPYDGRFIVDPYVSFASYDSKFLGREVPAVNTVHSESYSGDIAWNITENVQFKSITAYQKFNGRFTQNANNAPLPVALTDNIAGFEQFTQEFRVVGTSFNDMLDWAAGVFYFEGDSSLGGGAYLAASNIGFDQNDSTHAKNRSAFAHGTLHLTEQFSLTAGLRYTKESKSYRFDRVNVPAGTPFFAGGAFTSPEAEMDRVDYKIGLDYQLTDRVMVYGQFSTGFKGGGINPRPFTPAAAVPFGPETLNAYEIGLKSDLFDRLVRLNLAAYHSDYSNLQLSANGFDNNGAPSIVIANAGSARINGVEAEMEIRPARGLQIDMSASYTDFKIKDLGAAAGVSGGPTLDSKAPGVPEWKYNAGIQYRAELGNGGSLTPRFDVYYQSRLFNEWTNNPRAAEDGYALANARLTYNAPDEEWYAALSVTNLFDQFYYVNRFIQSGTYIFTGQPSRPREWAVTVGRRF
ncbi:TonB-dependent receptor-like protein [Sphingobium sp. SYK-6]|uniref:TonB-dependent receptor n=1 Tax=Sphingobium sp. (strain NBRC 103272 / SYK-6) TaxID=627192 RepID=UPI0002277F58|nr:TonB-dependent receptor [Sphingobium sp. SYK-6]BAK68480.1 TonB-dependent receptor-like protein [Sphingobium sp. SYK-6]